MGLGGALVLGLGAFFLMLALYNALEDVAPVGSLVGSAGEIPDRIGRGGWSRIGGLEVART